MHEKLFSHDISPFVCRLINVVEAGRMLFVDLYCSCCQPLQDLFKHKVRQFHFEIKNLFNSNMKPFSCEVHIRHANEVTVLPVEVPRV